MRNHTDIEALTYLRGSRRIVLLTLAQLSEGSLYETRGRALGTLITQINLDATAQVKPKWSTRQIRHAVESLADAGLLRLDGPISSATSISLTSEAEYFAILKGDIELSRMIRQAIDPQLPANPAKGELFKSLGTRDQHAEINELIEAIQGDEAEEQDTVVLFSETAPDHLRKGLVRAALLRCLDKDELNFLLTAAYQNAPEAEKV